MKKDIEYKVNIGQYLNSKHLVLEFVLLTFKFNVIFIRLKLFKLLSQTQWLGFRSEITSHHLTRR